MSSRSVLRAPAVLAFCALAGLAASACGGENTKLMVTGIDPDKGDVQGETYVHVHGNRFTADGPRTAKIYFGGHRGQVIRFVTASDDGAEQRAFLRSLIGACVRCRRQVDRSGA